MEATFSAVQELWRLDRVPFSSPTAAPKTLKKYIHRSSNLTYLVDGDAERKNRYTDQETGKTLKYTQRINEGQFLPEGASLRHIIYPKTTVTLFEWTRRAWEPYPYVAEISDRTVHAKPLEPAPLKTSIQPKSLGQN